MVPLHRVATVESAGVVLPPEWAELKARFDNLAALRDECPMLARLTDAVLPGDTSADIPQLRALALAEASRIGTEQVTNHVRRHVFEKLRALYGPAAPKNYRAIAQRFDKAAKEFSDAAALADPEADPATMIDQPDKVRKAWLSAELLASELTRLVAPLSAAAALCGVKGVNREPVQLALVCDPGRAHRRRAWEAFLCRTGRCGKWAALRRLNIPIRAYPAEGLGNFEAYREPRPVEHREEQIPGRPFGFVRTVHN